MQPYIYFNPLVPTRSPSKRDDTRQVNKMILGPEWIYMDVATSEWRARKVGK
jgi:hypothetical protein